MPLVVKDRVKETSVTTGTGTVTLIGAVSGFQSFSVIGNGNTTFYTITLDSAGEWEVGIGTYTASGTTLSRDIVLESSNGGSLVPFSAGTKTVFCTYPAEKSVYYDASGNVGIGTSSPDALLTVNTIASFGDGAVTTPSIAHKGDLNTGLWFPAADTMAASTAGTERIRFGSTGAIDMASTSSLQKNSINAYTLKNITYLTSGTAATYTTPTGVRALYVECVGGGGGGGGVDGQGAGTGAGGGGGGGGGYVAKLITSPSASYTYTIGAGGAAGAAGANNGANGGDTTFTDGTVLLTADGGVAGAGITAAASNAYYNEAGGGSGSGGDVVIGGLRGGARSRGNFAQYYGGYGGSSVFGTGSGGAGGSNAAGTAGTQYGSGGGGGGVDGVTTNYAGGAGYQGVIRITEYY